MSNTKDLRITELDFEAIKNNFRAYLKKQDQFSDYDFDASGMDVLLDIFAYNTHYNAFYINSAVNETFLATANSRQNIVKRAKSLNYTPKSVTAATAFVDLQIVVPEDTLINVFGGSNYGIVQLAKNSRFTTTIDNKKHIFVNPEAVILNQLSTTTFTAEKVRLRQGVPNTFRYTVNSDNEFQRFFIPDQNVDTSTLVVTSTSPNQTSQTNFTYHKNVNLQSINGETPIYFLSETASGLYEVEFGDGKYGYSPVNGEVIQLEYLVSSGNEPNGAKNFTTSSNITLSGNNITNATVTILSSERAFGGAQRETTESVRFNSPKYFQAQDRAVISNDYAAIIKNEFPGVESVNVWGGEQNSPPQYGKVFITAKPYGSLYFTETEKQQISNTVSTKMISSIRPVMIDPKYTFVEIISNIKFDSKRTLKRTSDIKNDAITAVLQYSNENLEKFLTTLYYSKFIQILDGLDSSIESNTTEFRLKKEFTPEVNVSKAYTFYFQNAIEYPYTGYKGSISSSIFKYSGFSDCRISQNQSGGLSIVSLATGNEVTIVEDAGTVDYANGALTLKAFSPESFEGGVVEVYTTPQNKDIESFQEFILRTRVGDINITVTDITTESSITQGITSTRQESDVTIDVSSTSF